MHWISEEIKGTFVALACWVLFFVIIALAIRLGRARGEKPLTFWQFSMRQVAVLMLFLAILFALLGAYYRLAIRPEV
jgi:hypothetical protein